MSEQLAQFGVFEHNGMPVVSVSGDVDLSNAHQLKDVLQRFDGAGSLAIDLSNVLFMDSTGLNTIAQYGRAQMESGHELHLIVTRPVLRKIFEITSFDKHFNVLESLDDLP